MLYSALHDILRNHTFVGLIGPDQPLSAIQHETNLYLVQHAAVAEELFYQLGLRQFGKINRFRLKPPPKLRDLVKIAVEAEPTREASGLGFDEAVEVL